MGPFCFNSSSLNAANQQNCDYYVTKKESSEKVYQKGISAFKKECYLPSEANKLVKIWKVAILDLPRGTRSDKVLNTLEIDLDKGFIFINCIKSEYKISQEKALDAIDISDKDKIFKEDIEDYLDCKVRVKEFFKLLQKKYEQKCYYDSLIEDEEVINYKLDNILLSNYWPKIAVLKIFEKRLLKEDKTWLNNIIQDLSYFVFSEWDIDNSHGNPLFCLLSDNSNIIFKCFLNFAKICKESESESSFRIAILLLDELEKKLVKEDPSIYNSIFHEIYMWWENRSYNVFSKDNPSHYNQILKILGKKLVATKIEFDNLYFLTGKFALASNDYRAAIHCLHLSLSKNESLRAYNLLSLAYYYNDMYKHSLYYAQKAIYDDISNKENVRNIVRSIHSLDPIIVESFSTLRELLN